MTNDQQILNQLNAQLDLEAVAKIEQKELLNKPIWTWEEMMSYKEGENKYLIDGFLWEGQIPIILAKEKVGKSILAKQMCCALTSGEEFLGQYDVRKPFETLYIQLEGTRGEMMDRFRRMTAKDGVSVGKDKFKYMYKSRLFLNVDSDCDKLMDEIEQYTIPEVIFIDPLYTAIKGSLSNDEVATALIGNLRRMQERFNGCCIVVVHHEHKPVKNQMGNYIDEGDDSIMGSFAFKAFASHVIRITNKKDGIRHLRCKTQRNGDAEDDIHLKMLEPEPLMFVTTGGASCGKSTENVRKFIQTNGPISPSDVIKITGMPKSTVNEAFKQLRKSKQIRKSGNSGKKALYEVI